MSSKDKNLSDVKRSAYNASLLKRVKISIVRSEWNSEITAALEDACVHFLLEQGIQKKNISIHTVPGSFELIYGAAYLLNYVKTDAIVCIGCIIKGETPHFDYISQAVSSGLAELNTQGKVPVIFGVLTTDNMEQAKDRAGGKHGNKGVEAAATALHMIAFSKNNK